jgi:cytochrome c5
MKKIILAMIIGASLSSCASKKETCIIDADVERAKVRFPEMTSDMLLNGQKLYTTHCTKCHNYAPGRFSEKKWEHNMPEMSKLAKIDSKTESTILQYLITFSKK